jgi:hypothetical protein
VALELVTSKKPLAGLFYFALGFRGLGVLAAGALGVFGAGALGAAGFLTAGFLAAGFLGSGRLASCTSPCPSTVRCGKTDISTTGGVSGAGGSILYGAVVSVDSGGLALLKKLLKNRNMFVSYRVFNKLVTIH